jgi:hypothetical protein
MRVMLMIKGDPEPGAAPSEELLTAMGRYNDELQKAGKTVSGCRRSRRPAERQYRGDRHPRQDQRCRTLHAPRPPSPSQLSAGLEDGRRAGRGGHRRKRLVGRTGRRLTEWDRSRSHVAVVGLLNPRPPDRPDLTEHLEGIGHQLDLAAVTLHGLDVDLGYLKI